MDPNLPLFAVVQHNINEKAGPQFLAVLLNSGLLGVLSVQVFLYNFTFPNDHAYLKCLVYGIYILEFMQSVLIIEAGFRTFVTGFGDVPAAFNQVKTEWLSVPILTAIDTFFVQGYYAYRISILARSKGVAGVIIALSLIQLGGGIAVGVHSEQQKCYTLIKLPHMSILESTGLGMWIVGSVLCDIIIAVCMTYYLSRYDTTIKRTNMILKKFIRLAIETGSLTAIIGILCFLLVTLPGTRYYYQLPMGIVGKIYTNSMLILINSRMLLGFEDPQLTTVSGLRFVMAPADNKNSAIETSDGDLEVDAEARAGLPSSSEPEVV